MNDRLRHTWRPNDILIFFHIPKTAGTSFNAILHQKFSQDEILEIRRIPAVTTLEALQAEVDHQLMDAEDFILNITSYADERYGTYKFIRGHISNCFPEFKNYNPIRMIMLRDPYERLYSNYNHIKRWPRNRWHDVVKSLTYEEYLLAQDRSSRMYGNMINYVLGREIESMDEVEEACEKLRQIDFIGITEQFDLSMALLHYMFGWPYKHKPVRMNVAKNKEPYQVLSVEAQEALHEIIQYDQIIYNHAMEIFNWRVQRMYSELHDEITDLETQNQTMQSEKEAIQVMYQSLDNTVKNLQAANESLQSEKEKLQKELRFEGVSLKNRIRGVYRAILPFRIRRAVGSKLGRF